MHQPWLDFTGLRKDYLVPTVSRQTYMKYGAQYFIQRTNPLQCLYKSPALEYIGVFSLELSDVSKGDRIVDWIAACCVSMGVRSCTRMPVAIGRLRCIEHHSL